MPKPAPPARPEPDLRQRMPGQVIRDVQQTTRRINEATAILRGTCLPIGRLLKTEGILSATERVNLSLLVPTLNAVAIHLHDITDRLVELAREANRQDMEAAGGHAAEIDAATVEGTEGNP